MAMVFQTEQPDQFLDEVVKSQRLWGILGVMPLKGVSPLLSTLLAPLLGTGQPSYGKQETG